MNFAPDIRTEKASRFQRPIFGVESLSFARMRSHLRERSRSVSPSANVTALAEGKAMEPRILRTLAALGVPGVALGVFYLLLRQFGFQFSTIDPTASAGIAILFLLIVAGVTLYALRHTGKAVAPTPEPRLVTEHVAATIQSGETRNFNIDLKRPGPVDLIIESIVPDWTGHEQQRTQWQQEGRGNTPELFVNICSAEEGNSCPPGVQKGSAGSLRRELRAGPATIDIFNFRENPPVTFSATIRLPE